MKHFSRSFKFFTKMAEEYFLLILFIVLIFVGYMTLGVEGQSELAAILYCLPYDIIIFLLLLITIIGISFSFQLYPMILSFNCTRKNIFLGINWMYLLISIQFLCLISIFCIILQNDITRGVMALLPAIAATLLAAIGISQIFMSIGLHFGKAGLLIMMICCVLVGAFGGFLFGIADGFSENSPTLLTKLSDYLTFSLSNHFTVIALFIGFLLYLAGNTICYLSVRKSSVHA